MCIQGLLSLYVLHSLATCALRGLWSDATTSPHLAGWLESYPRCAHLRSRYRLRAGGFETSQMRTAPDWGALRVGGVVVSVRELVWCTGLVEVERYESIRAEGGGIEGAQNALPE
ncbi:hypothetical protein DFH08DRAFT_905748 [Mycena albidolilacea]|uniref:Secreted protein n=1 Tax=Mycena albidolilacea TaxID=1033008 RepID=A0AAD6YZI0_9AGAR|nr:hypothetical protein DFH08DRAFT_905748 [Mycena albidolilacea]